MNQRNSTEKLIEALRLLAHYIKSEEGVATAVITEAADRMEELHESLRQIKAITELHRTWNGQGYTYALPGLLTIHEITSDKLSNS